MSFHSNGQKSCGGGGPLLNDLQSGSVCRASVVFIPRFWRSSDMKTRVIFRKFKQGGDIIALFPHVPGTNNPLTMRCYPHLGQHGSIEERAVPGLTVTATPSEYKDLLAELQRVGYDNLDIRMNLTSKDYKIRKDGLIRQVATSYLKPFTVIGIWPDVNGRFNDHVQAKNAEDAVKLTQREHGTSLQIIDVLAGHHNSLMGSK